jgi:hypothetical protein
LISYRESGAFGFYGFGFYNFRTVNLIEVAGLGNT